jgi:hypothetical protein
MRQVLARRNTGRHGGGPGGNRTHARQIRRLLLYPLSYRAIFDILSGFGLDGPAGPNQ